MVIRVSFLYHRIGRADASGSFVYLDLVGRDNYLVLYPMHSCLLIHTLAPLFPTLSSSFLWGGGGGSSPPFSLLPSPRPLFPTPSSVVFWGGGGGEFTLVFSFFSFVCDLFPFLQNRTRRRRRKFRPFGSGGTATH